MPIILICHENILGKEKANQLTLLGTCYGIIGILTAVITQIWNISSIDTRRVSVVDSMLSLQVTNDKWNVERLLAFLENITIFSHYLLIFLFLVPVVENFPV